MKTFVVCNRTTTKDMLNEMVKEVKTGNPRNKGWINLMDASGHTKFRANAIEKLMDSIIGKNFDTRLYDDYRELVVIMRVMGNNTLVWAKNGDHSDLIETIDSMFVYSDDGDAVPVLVRTQRDDILGKDLRGGGRFVNRSVNGSNSQFKDLSRELQLFGVGSGYRSSVLMRLPLLPGMKLGKCCVTQLAIVPQYSMDVWADHDGERYHGGEIHFVTRHIYYKNRDRVSSTCPVCSRRVADNDVREIIGYTSSVKCRDCMRKKIYQGCIHLHSEDLRYLNRHIIPMSNNVKYVHYSISGGYILSSVNEPCPLYNVDAYLQAFIKTSDGMAKNHGGFDDILGINILVRGEKGGERDGRIMVYIHRGIMVCLLYIREGDVYTMYGRVEQTKLQSMVSDIMANGISALTVDVTFSRYERDKYMLRHPVTIVAVVSDNYEAMNKIKKMYAASLLKGETV